jgi:hypothetical protein
LEPPALSSFVPVGQDRLARWEEDESGVDGVVELTWTRPGTPAEAVLASGPATTAGTASATTVAATAMVRLRRRGRAAPWIVGLAGISFSSSIPQDVVRTAGRGRADFVSPVRPSVRC